MEPLVCASSRHREELVFLGSFHEALKVLRVLSALAEELVFSSVFGRALGFGSRS
jgi:hypothetical protein